jgi:hypothetical protein
MFRRRNYQMGAYGTAYSQAAQSQAQPASSPIQNVPNPQPSQPVSGQGSFPAYVQSGEWQNVGSNITTGLVNFGNSLLSALSNPAVLGASAGVASNLIPSTATYDPPPQLESDVEKINEQLANRRSIQRAQQEEDPTGEKDYIGQNPLAADLPREYRENVQEGGLMSREGYAVGGIASRLIRKLLKRHKKDPEVQSSIYQVKKEIDDIDSELGGIGSENVELQKETVLALERDKRYLIEALEDIDVTGRPLDFDETGYPVLDDSGGVDFYGDLREPKQEGGEIDEQMTALMGEEEAMPTETMLPDEQLPALRGETEQMPAETMLPDEEMEENFVDYVVESALSPEDTNYLEEALATDERLSMIFDQVVETASEFSGSGPVEGPGTEVSDSIPARLSEGEFVMTAKAADQIGPDNLQGMMEQAETDADDVVRREMAVGGAFIAEDVDEDVVLPQQGVLDTSQREMLKLQLSANPRTQYRTVYG